MRLNLLSALLVLISSPAFAANGDMPASKDEPVQDFRIEVVGSATYNFGDRRFANTFKKTMLMGHSITTGLMNSIPLMGAYNRFGEGPGTILAKNYAKRDPVGSIAEGIGNMETGLTKMYRILEQQDDFEAAEGDLRRLSVMNKYYNEASAIVGVDAFYMTVVFNECADYGKEELRRTIYRFVNKSYYDGKVLVLGNVPKEDWWSVGPIELAVLYNNNEECRQMVNTALTEFCTHDKNCYINDVEGIVKTYNELGYLTLKDGSKIYKKTGPMSENQVRPGGINLSERGVQMLVEDILQKMTDHPPTPLMAPPMVQPN